MTTYRFKDLGFKLPEDAGLIKAKDMASFDKARTLVESAESRAAEIVRDAEAHFEAERERGLREGLEQANLQAFERLLDEHAELDRKLTEVEGSLAGLVTSCVRKIVYSFSDGDLAAATVHSALTKMRRENRVQLRLPESLIADFKSRIDGMLETFPEIELIDLVEDASLEAPNVIVESSIGRIDCHLGNKLDDLEAIITKVAQNLSADRRVEGETSHE